MISFQSALKRTKTVPGRHANWKGKVLVRDFTGYPTNRALARRRHYRSPR